jgi:hypothetical protein
LKVNGNNIVDLLEKLGAKEEKGKKKEVCEE